MPVLGYFKSIGATIELIEESYVEVHRGSQLTFRTKGTCFSKKEDYPVVACVRFDKNLEVSG